MAMKNEMEKQGVWLFRFRGTLPLIILVLGVCEYIITRIDNPTYVINGASSPQLIHYEILCFVVSLLGLAVRAFTVGYTPANTSGRNVAEQVADQLNTTGLYSVVRNPLYVGNFLMWLGIAMLTMNLWFIISFILLFWVYYERIIFAEEQFLTNKFGSVYTDWADKTPCFIPRLKGYVAPKLPFSWKKVIKKEKNGLLALLLVFWMMDVIGDLVSGVTPRIGVLAIASMAMLVIYLILKYIKHKTTLLDEEADNRLPKSVGNRRVIVRSTPPQRHRDGGAG